MKIWRKFINAFWQVEEPISTQDAARTFLVAVTLSLLVLVTLLGYQASSAVI